jgi:hypothetical protein
MCRENDRRISEAAQMARRGGGSKDLSMEAEQTAWLANHNVPTTNSDAKYTWHCAPEAKVRGMPCTARPCTRAVMCRSGRSPAVPQVRSQISLQWLLTVRRLVAFWRCCLT